VFIANIAQKNTVTMGKIKAEIVATPFYLLGSLLENIQNNKKVILYMIHVAIFKQERKRVKNFRIISWSGSMPLACPAVSLVH